VIDHRRLASAQPGAVVVADCERLPSTWAHADFDEIDSTNAEAMRRAVSGERGPLWITARRQTKGRGRSGRGWASAEGSIAATLLFRPDCALPELPQISLVAGVAAREAITEALPLEARPLTRLKWPNDVVIGAAKVCGILVESTILGGEPVVAIGIGINTGGAPALADRLSTGLADYGAATAGGKMSTMLAGALAHWLDIWHTPGRGFGAVRAAWLERGSPIGEAMTVHAGGERVAGRFAGLDAEGSLLLTDEAGTVRKFAFGDVALGAPKV
jgi:BirA family biotin operon repressor/biotin-[acetyl-CoA-carboxylase] ligase